MNSFSFAEQEQRAAEREQALEAQKELEADEVFKNDQAYIAFFLGGSDESIKIVAFREQFEMLRKELHAHIVGYYNHGSDFYVCIASDSPYFSDVSGAVRVMADIKTLLTELEQNTNEFDDVKIRMVREFVLPILFQIRGQLMWINGQMDKIKCVSTIIHPVSYELISLIHKHLSTYTNN
jgi:hypothetical protein